MHTSGNLLQQVRRALVAAFVLGGFACLLQLALPLYALHVLESAIPTASLETLALLTLIAAGAAVTLVCLAAARDRILLRAGLWLDHTLGQHMLENGSRLGTPPAELKKNADALAHFSGALSERAVVPALDAPWLALLLAVLALLNPIMAAVAAASALLLVLATLTPASRGVRLAQQKAQARENAATWWLAETLGTADEKLPAAAPAQWERLNRDHIAAAYAQGKSRAILQDAVRLVRAGAQIASIAVGAWLVTAHELTLAALFACVLINALLLGRLERLVASLPIVCGAMAAYRRLRALPADAHSGRAARDPNATLAAAAARRLNVRGPLALGLTAVLLFIVASLGAAYARLGDLAGLAGGAVFETRLAALQYPRGGAGERVHVTEGADVKAGDLIITRDTSELDRQIAMLKALAEAARSQLAQIDQETSALAGPAEPMPADRPKLASLEQRIGELEKEAQELLARIASAEQELAKSQIRAPVSGRVVALSVPGADASAAPGTIKLEIATADRPLLYRLLDPMLRNIHSAPAARAAADPRSEP
jgi:hypothetical protein